MSATKKKCLEIIGSAETHEDERGVVYASHIPINPSKVYTRPSLMIGSVIFALLVEKEIWVSNGIETAISVALITQSGFGYGRYLLDFLLNDLTY